MSDVAVWLSCVAALPVAVVAASWSRVKLVRLRWIAALAAALLVSVSLLPLALPALAAFELEVAWLGPRTLRLDALSRGLVPVAAGLWLLTVVATPRTRLGRPGLRRTALATLVTVASFLTESPGLLVALSAASVVIFLAALSGEGRVARVAAVYLGGSTVLFAAGVVALSLGGPAAESIGLWLVLGGALVRKGIFPFHAWLPEVFDRGRLGPAVLFSAPQTGAYVTALLVVPRASAGTLRAVAVLSLVTAVYGAALALFQRDARRAAGYLFVSQSALVMAGLDCTSEVALGGSLVVWISSALAFAGIARCLLMLEARRGRLDLSRHHGGYQQMPLLAVSFLVLGMACTGFPGTLGFVGQEMLVEGAVEVFPVLGFCVVVASALTGLAVVRMYLSLFCGRRDASVHLGLLPRERFAFALLTVVLVGTGLVPGPVVASRLRATEDILRWREQPLPSTVPRPGPHAARVLARTTAPRRGS